LPNANKRSTGLVTHGSSNVYHFARRKYIVIMVALWNRADHYIFILWFLLSSSFFFSSHNLSRRRFGCLPCLCTWCGFGVNVGRRSETCCTRLAENTGCKKVAKNRHLGAISQLFRAISSQLRHVSTIGKNLLTSNMSSRCPHNIVNFSPLVAEMGLPVWGTPANFNGFRDLVALLHGSQVVSVSQTLRH